MVQLGLDAVLSGTPAEITKTKVTYGAKKTTFTSMRGAAPVAA